MEYQTIAYAPNDNLIRTIPVDKPPERAVFIEADDSEKVIMLTNAWIRQTSNLMQCNINTEVLQDWKRQVIDSLPEDAEVRYSPRSVGDPRKE